MQPRTVLILFLMLSLSAISGCKKKKKGPPKTNETKGTKRTNVEVELIKPRKIVIKRVFHGETTAFDKRVVASETFGKIVRANYKENEFVKKGQLLARIDTRLAYQKIIQAQTNLFAARDLLKRTKALRRKDLATEQQLVDAQTRVKNAKVALDIGRVQLTQSVVRAPISGVVITKHKDKGEIVAAGTPIVTIFEIDKLKVQFHVPEIDLVEIKVGTRVKMETLAFPRGHRLRTKIGRISKIGYVSNPKNRTYPVEVIIDNSDRQYRIGMLTQATIETQRFDNAVVVKRDVVIDRDGRKLVYIARGDKPQLRYVTLGPNYEGNVIIAKGLQRNDWLIVVGQRDLRADTLIRVINAPKKGLKPTARLKNSPSPVAPKGPPVTPVTHKPDKQPIPVKPDTMKPSNGKGLRLKAPSNQPKSKGKSKAPPKKNPAPKKDAKTEK